MNDNETAKPNFEIEPWNSSADEFRLYAKVFWGLRHGQLAPLADYIAAGLPIDQELTRLIRDAIASDAAPFRLSLERRRGKKSPSELRETHMRKIRIGLWVRGKMSAAAPGQYDSVVKDAVSYFNDQLGFPAKKSAIEAAVAYLAAGEGFHDWIEDIAEVLARFPDE